MNSQIVNQQNVNVKPQPQVITGVAWAWGFEDGAKGVTVYNGYHLFVGAKLSEYKQGWAQGRKVRSN